MPIGLDANLPLKYNDVFGFYVLSQTKKENVQQKVKMLMLTAPGERVMMPGYGVGLRNFLFESDPELDILETIQEQVKTFLPDISIVSIDINNGAAQAFPKNGNENTLSVKFTYLIKGTDIIDAIKLVETELQ